MSLERGRLEAAGCFIDAIQDGDGQARISVCGPSTSGRWPHRRADGGTDLIASGSGGSAYVHALQGDAATWDLLVRRSGRRTRLSNISADFRRKLLEERDAARVGFTAQGPFPELPSRLNLPHGR